MPEITFSVDAVCRTLTERNRRGRRFSIVVVAEGARTETGDLVVSRVVEDSTDMIRLGGISEVLGAEIERKTGLETRVAVLGHLQRGGPPTAFDRVLATRFGREAAVLAASGAKGLVVVLRGQDIATATLEEVTARIKIVPLDHGLIKAARSTGVSFGESSGPAYTTSP
jgi:6-phosphofructokinase 1